MAPCLLVTKSSPPSGGAQKKEFLYFDVAKFPIFHWEYLRDILVGPRNSHLQKMALGIPVIPGNSNEFPGNSRNPEHEGWIAAGAAHVCVPENIDAHGSPKCRSAWCAPSSLVYILPITKKNKSKVVIEAHEECTCAAYIVLVNKG